MLNKLWNRLRNRHRPGPIPQPNPTPQPNPVSPVIPPPEPTSGSDKDVSQALVDSHNMIRRRKGLESLSKNNQLTASAQLHARTMAAARKMEHEGLQDGQFTYRLQQVGYRYANAGENIAMGYADVSAVTSGWESDPPHLRNILGSFTEMGGAVAFDNGGHPYWCVDFGRPGAGVAHEVQWTTYRGKQDNTSSCDIRVPSSFPSRYLQEFEEDL
jgi:uncharacterized protein YkwD